MAKIRKLKNGAYQLDFIDTRTQERVQRSDQAWTLRDAQQELRRMLAAIELDEPTTPTGRLRLCDLVAKWIDRRRSDVDRGDLARDTLKQYERSSRRLIEHLGATTQVRLLTPMRISEQLVDKFDGGPAALRQVVGDARILWRWAMRHELVVKNPFEAVSLPKKRRAERFFPTREAVAALIAAAAPPFALIFKFTAMTGLRGQEIRALRWADLDLERGVVRVRQACDHSGNIKPPKSEAGVRDVELGPTLIKELKELKLRAGARIYVFGSAGDRPRMQSVLNENLRLSAVRAGVDWPDGSGFHALRHFAASVWIEMNKTPKWVQVRMGHSSIQMTYDVYGHLFDKPSADTGAEIEAAMGL